MSLFLSLHQAAGLAPEEIAGYAPEVAEGVHATFQHLLVNTTEVDCTPHAEGIARLVSHA